MKRENVTGNGKKKRPGRPRKHESDKARMQAWRTNKKHEGRRLDCHVGNSASWQIKRLSATWGCSMTAAVKRLILETDDRYQEVLFPDQE